MSKEAIKSAAVSYEQRGDVGVWSVDDMAVALNSGDLEDGEKHFREVASQPSMSAAVVVVGNAENISEEELAHVNEQWTQLAEVTELDAVAYVADGVARFAISQKNEADGIETRGFEDPDAAVEWAERF